MTFWPRDTYGISISTIWHEQFVNGTTAFVRSRQWKQVATLLSCHMSPMVYTLVSHDTAGIVHGTITFSKLGQSKWHATRLFGHVIPMVPPSTLCNAESIINGTIKVWHYFLVMLHHLYQCCCHMTLLAQALASHSAIINGTNGWVIKTRCSVRDHLFVCLSLTRDRHRQRKKIKRQR